MRSVKKMKKTKLMKRSLCMIALASIFCLPKEGLADFSIKTTPNTSTQSIDAVFTPSALTSNRHILRIGDYTIQMSGTTPVNYKFTNPGIYSIQELIATNTKTVFAREKYINMLDFGDNIPVVAVKKISPVVQLNLSAIDEESGINRIEVSQVGGQKIAFTNRDVTGGLVNFPIQLTGEKELIKFSYKAFDNVGNVVKDDKGLELQGEFEMAVDSTSPQFGVAASYKNVLLNNIANINTTFYKDGIRNTGYTEIESIKGEFKKGATIHAMDLFVRGGTYKGVTIPETFKNIGMFSFSATAKNQIYDSSINVGEGLLNGINFIFDNHGPKTETSNGSLIKPAYRYNPDKKVKEEVISLDLDTSTTLTGQANDKETNTNYETAGMVDTFSTNINPKKIGETFLTIASKNPLYPEQSSPKITSSKKYSAADLVSGDNRVSSFSFSLAQLRTDKNFKPIVNMSLYSVDTLGNRGNTNSQDYYINGLYSGNPRLIALDKKDMQLEIIKGMSPLNVQVRAGTTFKLGIPYELILPADRSQGKGNDKDELEVTGNVSFKIKHPNGYNKTVSATLLKATKPDSSYNFNQYYMSGEFFLPNDAPTGAIVSIVASIKHKTNTELVLDGSETEFAVVGENIQNSLIIERLY